MAASLNKVMLIGNLGIDPELRITNDGKEVFSFSLATNESWKDKGTGEKKEKTEWHRIVVFNEALVKVIKLYDIKKGSKIYLEGQLQTRKWVDNSNQEKYTTEVILPKFDGKIIFLEKHSVAELNNLVEINTINNNYIHSELDDELPF